MNGWEIAAILVVGAAGSAEFASATLVHPVIRRLALDDQLAFEKGLLRTYGRIMPVAMTTATILAIAVAVGRPSAWTMAAAAVLGVALVVTILGNVPINIATGRITARNAPDGFLSMRRRWDAFQLTRASLQLIGFPLLTIGLAGAVGPPRQT